MEFNLIITEEFEKDLDEALNYISKRPDNTIAAKNLMDKISGIFSQLKDNPFLYPKHHDSKIAKQGYRFAVVGNFLIFYLADEKTKTVYPACRKTSRWSVFLQADAVFDGKAVKNKNRS
ncbi:MAG: type II toxin-antitoxin system RelE/ParE family toxin [Ruminococcaceae bacterium]|nr:type II toxin-antitoxin system RelE/ParE family toxin [Oscillospiraceae bacterium]